MLLNLFKCPTGGTPALGVPRQCPTSGHAACNVLRRDHHIICYEHHAKDESLRVETVLHHLTSSPNSRTRKRVYKQGRLIISSNIHCLYTIHWVRNGVYQIVQKYEVYEKEIKYKYMRYKRNLWDEF